jgi:adenosyl cobinamide kinase/adenosyl cobinamide phosphate guanylyltransferase
MITLILGGARAGKSRRALTLAGDERTVAFVATAQAFDDDMHERILLHRAERPSVWQTIEVPIDVAAAVRGIAPASTVIIDCVTLWVSNILLSHESDLHSAQAAVEAHVTSLITVLRQRSAPTLLVSNEVGLGIVPSTSLGRHYRDLLGRANAQLAAAAERVELLVAGLPLVLKS